ncbi:FAD-binding oxidoreductase [Limibacter armeniacum]|uniref:FAD-binding oxidoreductase n=1 Tax=Limibacter armeniacum TaxID=466084 RepID=UPI002FE5F966
MKKIANWGNYPHRVADINTPVFEKDIHQLINNDKPVTVRGLGRCYGDASLGEHIISMDKMDKILHFDANDGIITCQAGTSLDKILNFIVPKGWFLPVTPGTKFITVGGAIASDVHGKNHHIDGCFSQHIIEMKILLSDGQTSICSPTINSEFFRLTCGGLGLSGVILEASFSLKKIETSQIDQQVYSAPNLKKLMEYFDEYSHYTYSVAWIDCFAKGKSLGRGHLIVGEHAPSSSSSDKLKQHASPKINIPFRFPGWILNKVSIWTFNNLFYFVHKFGPKKKKVDYDAFFYPLDKINNWNKMYGKTGFLQYQFVLPLNSSYEGLQQIIGKISSNSTPSFLCVLKKFGSRNENIMSFPDEGFTLALDFPIKNGVFELLDELDEIVHQMGGKVYLTKDARLSRKHFEQGYPKHQDFMESITQVNPKNKLSSDLLNRLTNK